jgi:hypothetical protein
MFYRFLVLSFHHVYLISCIADAHITDEAGVEKRVEKTLLDLTDKQNRSFRYVLWVLGLVVPSCIPYILYC